jgi:hypothetical protein
MSCKQNFRKFQSMSAPAVLAQIAEEGGAVLQEIARRKPAKEAAREFGYRPRHIYNMRDGETGIGYENFFLAAQSNPELRELALKWLGYDSPLDPSAVDTMRQIKRLAAALPEAGDAA